MNKYLYYIKQIGLMNILKGYKKKIKLKKLQKKYQFDSWNLYPFEHREYAMWIINHINKQILNNDKSKTNIVEIGCGLGEIISNLEVESKTGYDISESVIEAARELNKCKNTQFMVGSFDSIINQTIDVLIVVNFTAMISPEILTEWFTKLLEKNHVYRIIVECIDEERYTYLHNYPEILPNNYKLEIKSKMFPPIKRWIEVYKLKDQS